jgi:hypothetical protein
LLGSFFLSFHFPTTTTTMPRGLSSGYCVVVGTNPTFSRDDINNYGAYYHGHISVKIGNKTYSAAVDANKPRASIAIEWLVADIDTELFENILKLPNGRHSIQRNSTSHAIDYVRSDAITVHGSSLRKWRSVLGSSIFWKKTSGVLALDELEKMVTDPNNKRIFIFGEPFGNGNNQKLGVHNVHQNQGNEIDSKFGDEDGIWQDGMVAVQKKDNTVTAFLVKFLAQSYETDDDGHPIPDQEPDPMFLKSKL